MQVWKLSHYFLSDKEWNEYHCLLKVNQVGSLLHPGDNLASSLHIAL